MTGPVRFEVFALPAPQGSKTRMPNGAMVDGTSPRGRANLASFKAAVRVAVDQLQRSTPMAAFAEPVGVDVVFRFPLPASDPYRVRHATAPDLDKCCRLLGDSLVQAGLLADDRFICRLNAHKVYARGEPVGATVSITPLGDVEADERGRLKADARQARKTAKAAS